MNTPLAEAIRAKALAVGFDAVGFAPATPSARRAEFERWLAAGMNAGMTWLARDPARRTDPELVQPGVRCIVSVGLSYFVEDPPAACWNDPTRGRVARSGDLRDGRHRPAARAPAAANHPAGDCPVHSRGRSLVARPDVA